METEGINEKISQLLSDPEGMAKISAMAQSLFGNEGEKSEEPKESGEAQMLVKAAKLLGDSGGRDDRAQLLLALKPHLSAEKGERVDKAIKLLRLARLLPLIKESDLFL